jgi:hypothetical protein
VAAEAGFAGDSSGGADVGQGVGVGSGQCDMRATNSN